MTKPQVKPPTKAQKRLDARVKDWELTVRNSKNSPKAFKKPGSVKK